MFHHHKAHTKFIPVLTSGHIVNTATYFEHLFRLKTFEHLCTLKTLKCNSYIRANIKDYEKNGCFLISTQKICHALYLQGLDQNNNGVLLTYVCWGAQSSVSNLDSFQKRLHHHVSNEIFVVLNPYQTKRLASLHCFLLSHWDVIKSYIPQSYQQRPLSQGAAFPRSNSLMLMFIVRFTFNSSGSSPSLSRTGYCQFCRQGFFVYILEDFCERWNIINVAKTNGCPYGNFDQFIHHLKQH